MKRRSRKQILPDIYSIYERPPEWFASYAWQYLQRGDIEAGTAIINELFGLYKGWLIRQKPVIKGEEDAFSLFCEYVGSYGLHPHKSIMGDLERIIEQRAADQGKTEALSLYQNLEHEQNYVNAEAFDGTGFRTFSRTHTSNPERVILDRTKGNPDKPPATE